MLNDKDFERLKNGILKASADRNDTQLVYECEWIYLHPSHEMYIGGKGITHEYDIPSGFDGYGDKDLEKLVTQGILKIISKTYPSDPLCDYEIVFEIVRT